MSSFSSSIRRTRRSNRVRKAIGPGTAARPRLCVYRSRAAVYAQIIDDDAGKTLASAQAGSTVAEAEKAGAALSAAAKKAGVEHVVFDRNGFPFHGRVAALANAARKGGLQF